MPRQDNKTLLQPIDIIFRFLQGISFFKMAVHLTAFPFIVFLYRLTKQAFRSGCMINRMCASRE